MSGIHHRSLIISNYLAQNRSSITRSRLFSAFIGPLEDGAEFPLGLHHFLQAYLGSESEEDADDGKVSGAEKYKFLLSGAINGKAGSKDWKVGAVSSDEVIPPPPAPYHSRNTHKVGGSALQNLNEIPLKIVSNARSTRILHISVDNLFLSTWS